MNFLTATERSELKAQHRLERDRRICDRIKALLLYDEGWSFQQIAEVLLLSSDSIRNHVADYKKSHKLKPEGGGSSEKLTLQQSCELEKHLQNHTYLYVKNIVAYLQARWKVTYSISGMTTWLERHGFAYKKPAVVPGKANKKEQEKWIKKYEKLKQHLSENETICFMDGVHPTHNTQLAYGWIKKGVRKEIASNSGRSRLNLSGMIDILSHQILITENKTLNGESTIDFFCKVELAYPTMKKVHLFCDNASYYRNQAVSEYLKTSKIKLHFLPPYSPNLNPIERLWKWMKETVMYNTYYEEFDDFRSAVLNFFSTVSGFDPGSEFGKCFRQRVGDRFRAINAPVIC